MAVSGVHLAQGGRRSLRTPAHLAGERFGFGCVGSSTPWMARLLLWQPRMEPALASRTTHLQGQRGEPALGNTIACGCDIVVFLCGANPLAYKATQSKAIVQT